MSKRALCQFGFGTGAIVKAPAEEAASEALFSRWPELRMFSRKGAISELDADPCEEHEEDERTGEES